MRMTGDVDDFGKRSENFSNCAFAIRRTIYRIVCGEMAEHKHRFIAGFLDCAADHLLEPGEMFFCILFTVCICGIESNKFIAFDRADIIQFFHFERIHEYFEFFFTGHIFTI